MKAALNLIEREAIDPVSIDLNVDDAMTCAVADMLRIYEATFLFAADHDHGSSVE